MNLTGKAECLRLLHDLQKASRTVLAQLEKLETLTRPIATDSPASSEQLLKFVNSDHDEVTLMLLVAANRFVKLTKLGDCGYTSTLPVSSLKDLRILRNLWEHRDEKPMLLNGKWHETRPENLMWLEEAYGENWALAYAISVGPDDIRIGNKLSLQALRLEAKQWINME